MFVCEQSEEQGVKLPMSSHFGHAFTSQSGPFVATFNMEFEYAKYGTRVDRGHYHQGQLEWTLARKQM